MKINTEQAIQVAKIGAGLILLGIASKLVRGFMGDDKPPPIDSEIADNQPAQVASMLKNAIGEWYNDSDEKAILSIAYKIQDYPKVQAAYVQMTGKSLTADLQKVLNANEYADFIAIINKSKLARIALAVAPPSPMFSKQQGQPIIAANINTPIYSFPTTDSKLIGFTRTYGASLGKALKRINNPEGSWYLVSIEGKNGFVRENHLT
jgi:hypothetical protein